MVRRLIQDEQVRLGERQGREQHARLLPTAALADLDEVRMAAQAEPAQ